MNKIHLLIRINNIHYDLMPSTDVCKLFDVSYFCGTIGWKYLIDDTNIIIFILFEY